MSDTRKMNPRWIAGQLLVSNLDVNGDLEAQRQYASATWARAGVVRYAGGPSFLGHDSACGVDVGSIVLEFPVHELTEYLEFPWGDQRNPPSYTSQIAVDFKSTFQGGQIPVVALFPWLAHFNLSGNVIRDPNILGATPLVEPGARGVIYLSINAIRSYGYKMILAHEMVHLLTGRIHGDLDAASVAWESFLTLFSPAGSPNLPVWNGRTGSEAGIVYHDWSEFWLTLASVRNGDLVYDQCSMGRSSPWLQ